jgi:Icc-related predicted phosphoesterase
MIIGLVSDLHTEIWVNTNLIGPKKLDVLVLAGDIGKGVDTTAFVKAQQKKFNCPVVVIAGNHEFYHNELIESYAFFRQDYKLPIHFLQNNEVILNGVRFLGTTLWTDYKLSEPDLSQDQAMVYCGKALNDHFVIKYNGGRFTPYDALQYHETAIAWLEKRLEEPFDGPTVVVTHHCPSPKSIHEKYAGSSINAAFSSNLDALIEKYQPAFWLHGHTHHPFDYKIGDTRVVCNPRGYPNENLPVFNDEVELKIITL